MTFRPATHADAVAIADLIRAYDRAHGNTSGAPRLYSAVGMHETHRIDRWEKPADRL